MTRHWLAGGPHTPDASGTEELRSLHSPRNSGTHAACGRCVVLLLLHSYCCELCRLILFLVEDETDVCPAVVDLQTAFQRAQDAKYFASLYAQQATRAMRKISGRKPTCRLTSLSIVCWQCWLSRCQFSRAALA